jgi:hypothetical protein
MLVQAKSMDKLRRGNVEFAKEYKNRLYLTINYEYMFDPAFMSVE